MNNEDIANVLALNTILTQGLPTEETIAALLDWRNSTLGAVIHKGEGTLTATVVPAPKNPPKGRGGKATESTDSDPQPPYEASPDPASDDDPGF